LLAHERDRRCGRHAIEDGQAGKGRSGTPVATSAADLNSLRRGALPASVNVSSTAAGSAGRPKSGQRSHRDSQGTAGGRQSSK